ncbi:Phytoene dehydrogenase, partial [Tetrabaena socialis]
GAAQGVGAAASGGAEGRRVVIVGGGWAGFGAAKHLSEQGYDVTLLEASPNPGGLSAGWRTASGRAYKNTFKLIEELKLPSWPLTDFTTSGFWNPKGLVTEAPVFSKLPRLPTLVGQFVHTFPLYWALPLEDRLTMLPFLATLADYVSSEDAYEQYDKMSAYELFRRCGVSTRCYQEFLRPTLLVGLFAPPEELSAAAVLETLYFYALAHQNDFDVCWPKGSIAELIFQPMVERIRAAGGRVQGSRLVTGLTMDAYSGEVTSVEAADRSTGEAFSYPADAVVFAVGITGMQKLVAATPALAKQPDFRAIMELRALDVIATRIWFDTRVATRYPANVLSGFEATAGATFFNLNDLQDEYRDEPGSVIAADLYHANMLLPLSDEAIIERMVSHITACEPGFSGAKVIDSIVLRYPKAVTHFSPGSYPHRPFQATTIPNVVMAGDWVKGVPHGANGLSQVRAN